RTGVQAPAKPQQHQRQHADAQRLVRGVHPEILRRARQFAHGQADDGRSQDQQHDQPVEALANRAPAFAGVLQGHGSGSGSGGAGGGSDAGSVRGSASAGTPASASAASRSSRSRSLSASVSAAGGCGSGASARPASRTAARLRMASASIRSSTRSPIIEDQASTPKSLRLSTALAENPTVRRNGGSGCRLAAFMRTSSTTSRSTP